MISPKYALTLREASSDGKLSTSDMEKKDSFPKAPLQDTTQ